MKSQKFNKTNVFTLTLKVVGWILRVYRLKYPYPLETLSALLTRFDSMAKSRGIYWTVSYIKDVRTAYLNYLAGSPIKVKSVKQTSDGLPIILGNLIPILRKGPTPVVLQLINTILFCTRSLNLGKSPDIGPIIDPPKGYVNIGHYMGDF